MAAFFRGPNVNASLLDGDGVVVTDRNAAAGLAYFGAGESALAKIDSELVFAESWKHPDDQFEERAHKAIKCAEILVPDVVSATLIDAILVADASRIAEVRATGYSGAVREDRYLFFKESRE